MPCFKGLAVSIHTPEGPLPEYSIQRQSRYSRINSYIPVPPAKVSQNSLSNKPEQSTFAISITLLTPGLNVPYSQPKPTPENPYPRPRVVSGLPTITGDRGRYGSVIGPYMPLTTSPNETIAAYIYFDGRAKEEVATLLRRGEETWVNSRWVGVPESEGGGLAEREFLFREVGLERWLNGLDLQGNDAAAKIQRRRLKMEKKRRRRKPNKDSDDEAESSSVGGKDRTEKGVLRYVADDRMPLEQMSDSDEMFLSGSDSEDDDPVPESTGQIKVALFRVLASGEIKRGEYSPQFDAHDDDDEMGKSAENGGKTEAENTEEVDHTTSFAQPKSLDPKSISTQTVTGIDPPDRPFAVFTFLYRGEKQLQKMGILPSSPKIQEKTAATNGKRRSLQADFAKLKPLNPNGLVGFSKFRDPNERTETNGVIKNKAGKKGSNDGDSDDEVDPKQEIMIKLEGDDLPDANGMLSAEDAKRQGELAEGVQKIRLKRQHSADPNDGASPAPAHRKSPPSNTPTAGSTPPYQPSAAQTPPALLPSSAYEGAIPKGSEDMVGSPLKKQRASLSGLDEETMRVKFGLGLSGARGDVLGAMEQDRPTKAGNVRPVAEDKGIFGGPIVQEKVVFGAQPVRQEAGTVVKAEEMEEEL